MKNSKRCPKCQSDDILRVPGKRQAGGAGNLISVSSWNLFNTVAPTLHVCASCGYTENWVMSARDIARVKARYAD
jgi:predicted nucleic-acid-binding Zn-ribbon protein